MTEQTKTTETMTIRQMCDAYDVTPRTLRFYEAKELLFPIRQGTRRLFTKRDRARLTLILRGTRFGFSLEEIRKLLDLYDEDGERSQIAAATEVGRTHLAEMVAQRDELGRAIAELEDQIRWAEGQLAQQDDAPAAA
ncbi:MAG: MerR family transcriptional regulator [Shimia sp.]